MKYFSCVGSLITNNARCRRRINSRIVVAQAALNNKNNNSPANWKERMKCYIWNTVSMLLRVGHFRKYIRNPWKFWNVVLEKDGEDKLGRSCENEEILHRVKENRSFLHKRKWRKANWNCHILPKNFFLKHIIEGKIQGMERRGRRHSSYWMT